MRALNETGVEGSDAARRHRNVARCTDATLQVGTLTKQGTRPVLGQTFPAPFDAHDAVEDEQDLGARLTLLEEDRAGWEALDPALAPALHELRRQGGFERRLDGGHQRLGVLVTPRAVLAERLAVPVLEV